MGLKDHQIQWICNHLGHTEAVHKTHYRHTLEGIERIELGKLILLQDKNLISKFQSKGLENIQFEGKFKLFKQHFRCEKRFHRNKIGR